MRDLKNYHLGLLYLVHLLMSSDGDVSSEEENAWNVMKKKEEAAAKLPAPSNEELLLTEIRDALKQK